MKASYLRRFLYIKNANHAGKDHSLSNHTDLCRAYRGDFCIINDILKDYPDT